jgi:hypothetical protein
MAKARFVFYLHVVLTVICATVAFYELDYRWVHGTPPTWLNDFLHEYAIQFWFCTALVSTVIFPAVLAYLTVSRLRARWWVPLIIQDVWLSSLQLLSLSQLQPFRW